MDNLFFLIRGRGRVLLHNGHEYYFSVKYKNLNSIWRCCNYKKNKCTGSVTVCKDELVIIKHHEHSQQCFPNENKNTMEVMVCQGIEEAGSSVEETVPKMYKKTVMKIKDKGLHMVSELPTYEKFKSAAYRRRNKVNQVQKMAFDDADEVKIPYNTNDFLLSDFHHEANHGISDVGRILLFSSKEARQIISTGKVFLCDGTFKYCPNPFKQLYVIFCDVGSTDDTNKVVPVVYSLLTNKNKNTYIKMLELIRSQITNWEPRKFITDYEQSAIAAIKFVFPNIQHHGCYYHYQNKLWRKAKALSLKDSDVRKVVSLCTVLPLLPIDKIDEGWKYITNENKILGTESNKNLQQFMSYMNKYWMPKKLLWCCFGERHRTTNTCEGWNSQYNSAFKRKPTTIAHCLKVLWKDANLNTTLNAIQRKRTRKVMKRNSYIMNVQMMLINNVIDVPLFLEKLRV